MSSPRSRSGGSCDGQHGQPVVDVLAQPPFRERLRRRAIGGGDHAHVDRQIRGAADAAQSLGFEHAQQARLQIERHFGDLVEQQGPAVRALEDSFTRAHARP